MLSDRCFRLRFVTSPLDSRGHTAEDPIHEGTDREPTKMSLSSLVSQAALKVRRGPWRVLEEEWRTGKPFDGLDRAWGTASNLLQLVSAFLRVLAFDKLCVTAFGTDDT